MNWNDPVEALPVLKRLAIAQKLRDLSGVMGTAEAAALFVADGKTTREVCNELGVFRPIVATRLGTLAKKGMLVRVNGGWLLTEKGKDIVYG